MKQSTRMSAVAVLSLGAGVFAGALWSPHREPIVTERQYGESAQAVVPIGNELRFVNPLLDCESFRPSGIASHRELQGRLTKHIDRAVSQGVADRVSVYFRSLNNGPWIGIGHERKYSPASLLKVPVMVAAYKRAEGSPDFLATELRYSGRNPQGVRQNILEGDRLQGAGEYTVEQLVDRMIRHSDNEAMELLREVVRPADVTEVLREMHIVPRGEPMQGDYITVREYASVFRLLYNATYLGRHMSEKALDILSESSFRQGLPGLLPADVPVAHKFGERGTDGIASMQLHDCGIVYAGATPYLLCVMTEGRDLGELTRLIAQLSRMVYDNVTARGE